MATEKTIKAQYKKLHDDLSEIYYDGTMGLTKEEFDAQHGLIWETMKKELIAEGYLTIPKPSRDLAVEVTTQKTEIDELRTSIKALEMR